MHPKRTPRIEYAAYLQADEPQSVVDLPLETFTLKALADAEIASIQGARELVAKAQDPAAELPKGFSPRRVKEVEAALKAGGKPTAASVSKQIFAACEAVARRCGDGAMFHSGDVIQIDGKPLLRIRWSAGASWRAQVRACKSSDRHFHACPLRTLGQADTVGEILD